MKKQIMNKKTNHNHKKSILLVVSALMVAASCSYAGGLEAVAKGVHGLVKGELGKSVLMISTLIGGGISLYRHNIGGAVSILAIGSLIGFFLSAVDNGSFMKLLAV